MILIALDMNGRATVVDPSPIAQGTDSESVVLLSPFPVRCPVMMGWVMPDGLAVEIPLDDTENGPKTRYWNMTNVVLPEGYDGNVQSVWVFKPTANLTAQYGKALACFYVQKPVQSEDPLTHTTIQGYKSLTYNPVEIYVTETLNPIPDGELDPESPLLEQVLAAITYYNTYLADIARNGVSTVHDTEGEPQRKVYTDSTPTEDSNNLITSGAVFNAEKSAREYAAEQAESAERDAKEYTDEQVQTISQAQEQDIAAAEHRANAYADNAAEGAEQRAKAYAEQKADEAEEAAKEYAASLAINDGYGTPVYEDGTLSPALYIPKIYNDISEVDDTFDKNTTFAQLVQKMESNSKLVSKCFYGEKDGIVVDTYAALFPRGMDASNDLITIKKKTAEGKEVVSAELSHNKVAVWGGAEISSPSIAVEGSYTYRCPPTATDNTVYKISAGGMVETLSIDSHGDGTGVPVQWIYAIRWINELNGTDKGVLLVGADHLNGLYFCRLLNGELQWVAEAAGRTLPQTLIHAVDLHNVVCVYTPENKFILLDENGKLNNYGNETFTNVVSVCGVSEASLYTNAFNFIVSDAQDNLLLYTGNNSVENTATVSLYASGGITLPTDIKLWRFNVLSGKTNGKENIYNTILLYASGWLLSIIDLSAEHAVDIPVGSALVSLYGLHSGDAKMGGVAVAIKDQTTQKISVLIDGKEFIAGGRVSSSLLPTYSLPPAAHMLFTRNADVDRVYWGVNCYFLTSTEVERYVRTTNSDWKQVDTDDVGTKIYENGSFSARLDLPKIYSSIDEIDSSFDDTTTPAQLASAMQSNAELTATVDSTDYTSLIPSGETGQGLLKVYKKTTGANSISFFGYQGKKKWVGVYDGTPFVWQKQADDADLTAAITEVEAEINSFVKANNQTGAEGLTFTYDDTNGTAVCTGGSVSGSVVFPAYVKNGGKWYKVTSIGANAFQNNTDITSIRIPLTIESIGDYAFDGCSYLRTLHNIGNPLGNLQEIGGYAFRGTDVRTLEFYQKKLILGYYSFQNSSVQTVRFLTEEITLKNSCFSSCASLTDIEFITGYIKGEGTQHFYNCTSLVNIVATCNYINNISFDGCTSLTNVEFNCNRMGGLTNMFWGCSSLQTAIFPPNINWGTYQGDKMFYGTNGVKAIFLVDGDEPFSSTHEGHIKNGATNLTIEYRYRVVQKRYLHNIKVTGFSVAGTTLRFSLITTSNTQMTSHDAILASLTSENDIFGVCGQMGETFVGPFSSVELVQSTPDYLSALSFYYDNTSTLSLKRYNLNGVELTFSDNVVEL